MFVDRSSGVPLHTTIRCERVGARLDLPVDGLAVLQCACDRTVAGRARGGTETLRKVVQRTEELSDD